jgi:nitroreductase
MFPKQYIMNSKTMISMQKSTERESPLLKEIEDRRSLRAYSTQPVEEQKIKILFEAARWAPSSNNEQPWVYVYATKEQPELWNKLFSTLAESNQTWAINAPLLILGLARKNFIRNDKPNGSARYDLGSANAFLSLQATQLGLNVHQMGGFDRPKAIENLNIPDSYEPIVILAIGYAGDPDSLSENLKQRELGLRERYTQESFVMNKTF